MPRPLLLCSVVLAACGTDLAAEVKPDALPGGACRSSAVSALVVADLEDAVASFAAALSSLPVVNDGDGQPRDVVVELTAVGAVLPRGTPDASGVCLGAIEIPYRLVVTVDGGAFRLDAAATVTAFQAGSAETSLWTASEPATVPLVALASERVGSDGVTWSPPAGWTGVEPSFSVVATGLGDSGAPTGAIGLAYAVDDGQGMTEGTETLYRW